MCMKGATAGLLNPLAVIIPLIQLLVDSKVLDSIECIIQVLYNSKNIFITEFVKSCEWYLPFEMSFSPARQPGERNF